MRLFIFAEFWLEWIEDEKQVEENREKMVALFERAVKDYLSKL